MYVGMAAVTVALGLILDTWWPILLLPPALWLVQRLVIAREERYLCAGFLASTRPTCGACAAGCDRFDTSSVLAAPRAFLCFRGREIFLRGSLASSSALVANSLRQLLAAGFAIPFLEGLVGDLSLDEELGELAPLRLTLERQRLTLLVTPVAQRRNAS